MKKVFTLMMSALTAMVARATDFDEPIVVNVNGIATTQHGVITITKDGDGYSLTLKNFALLNAGSVIGVGNIAVEDIIPQQAGEAVILADSRDITITDGDDPNVAFWMGPMMGPIPITLRAALEGDRLHAVIDIDLSSSLGQIIHVSVGNGYQFPNPTFEEWHASTDKYEEPNGWHSFETATGTLAALSGHHIEKLEDQGFNGSACARIYSTSIFGIVANGTMTTGRMNAGSMSVTDTSNNAYLDTSKTDVDGNGDPFYMPLVARPDSLTLLVKFHQGKADHPYATVSAAITDGTYYQDPQDKEYTNVVATAANRQIAVTGDEWVRLSIPFEYKSSSLMPKAMLVTISTNADAGQGSDGDEVLVDNIALVYNTGLKSLNVAGFASDKLDYEVANSMTLDEIQAVAQSSDAYVVKTLGESEDGKVQAEIAVYAADLSAVTVYTVKFMNSSVGISSVENATSAPQYYNLGGQQLHSPRAGQVLIVRQADGRYLKVKK